MDPSGTEPRRKRGAAVILTLAATLFALIFSIGILVDDAIVVVESIHRHRHRHQPLQPGKALRDIIPAAVDEGGGPTILATLTVIAAQLPMAFVSGLIGPCMSPVPISSSPGMAISLAIAFTVTPWLVLRLMKPPAVGADHAEAGAKTGLSGKLQTLFQRRLTPFLSSAKKHWLLLAGFLATLLLSVGLAAVQWLVLKRLPFDNKSKFQLIVDLPTGLPLEDTAAAPHDLAGFLARQPERGDLQVNRVDKQHRHEQSHAIAQRLRPELEKIALRHGARLKLVEVPPGPPVMSPLGAEVYGPDDAGRHQPAARVAKVFAATPDITAIATSLHDGLRDMAAAYAVGLVLICVLVVAQFRSDLTPLVILAPIPIPIPIPIPLTLTLTLTLIGVIPGHALRGAQITPSR